MTLLREAIRSFDLETWLTERGADASESEWVLDCPKCGKHNLSVNTDRRIWHCWTCERYEVDAEGKRRALEGAGGLVDLLQLVDGIDRSQAIDQILNGVIFSYRDVSLLPLDELRDQFISAVREPSPLCAPEGWRPITEPIPFMLRRGITMQDVYSFGLGWCETGRYAGRFIFPVWEQHKLVYFQARAMWDPRPGTKGFLKALNPPAGEGAAVSSELLMNIDQAKLYSRVAIVEGPTDLIRTGVDAVCTFGKQITAPQISRLRRAGVRALDLMWDGPSPSEPRGAWDEILAVAPLLSSLFDLRLVWLPHGDPGDHSRDALNWYRYHARSVSGVSDIQKV